MSHGAVQALSGAIPKLAMHDFRGGEEGLQEFIPGARIPNAVVRGGISFLQVDGESVSSDCDDCFHFRNARKVLNGVVKETHTARRIVTEGRTGADETNLMRLTELFTKNVHSCVGFDVGWLEDYDVWLHGCL